MRTFVAIDIPEEIRAEIATLVSDLRRKANGIRWARPEGLHITLKFIGEIPSSRVELVQQHLQSVPPRGQFPIAVRSAGFFPNERAPRVLWLGVQAGEELAKLAGQIDESLAGLGIATETRPYSAHLTLGRMQSANDLLPLKDSLKRREPIVMGEFVASDFYLYESKLGQGGSIYRKIARFPVAGS